MLPIQRIRLIYKRIQTIHRTASGLLTFSGCHLRQEGNLSHNSRSREKRLRIFVAAFRVSFRVRLSQSSSTARILLYSVRSGPSGPSRSRQGAGKLGF